jgi:hypothetical protein
MTFASRLASEVFTHRPSARVTPRRTSSLDLSLPSRVRLRRRRREQGCPRPRLPPLRFLPLRRLASVRQLLIRGFHTPVRALSAFLTLSGLCSARRLPALFHAGPALGVSCPPGTNPARRAVRPLGRRCPPEVDHRLAFAAQQTPTPSRGWDPTKLPQPLNEEAAVRASSPPTGPCSLRASVSSGSGLDPPTTATLMGFLLPRGFPLHDGDRPSGPSSHGLRLPARRLDRQLPSRVFDRRSGWLDSLEPATPCEVCHLIDPPR